MSSTIRNAGVLHVVATPIGNAADLAPRARETLAGADLVLAEDTRHTRAFLHRFGIDRPLLSLHEHNERERIPQVIERLRGGAQVALVSDAGTPLVSDPGYRLVAAVRAAGLCASPIPGPSAAIAALSVAGLPSDRFVFEGFLPARAPARRARLAELRDEPRTIVFFEAGRRAAAALGELSAVFGPARAATLARELTKLHEEVIYGTLGELAARAAGDPDVGRGELVIVVAGAPEPAASKSGDDRCGDVLRVLLDELPVRQAASLAARLTGVARNEAYRLALELASARDSAD
jgi:16S rRNA (cytidine1402-2'-O)-methyltransferase